MKNILTILILSSALAMSACSKTHKDQPEVDTTLPPEDTQAVAQEDVNQEGIPQVNLGAQEQLNQTAGDRVFFDFDSTSLTQEAQDTLTKQAQWLSTNGSNVTVEGHCDERGTREYNLALGEKRANAVKQFLVSHGVAANRITTISYGKEFPEFLGSTEEAWSKNRRAVTVVNN
jgi:peptidoglycan-associated lipoprotein